MSEVRPIGLGSVSICPEAAAIPLPRWLAPELERFWRGGVLPSTWKQPRYPTRAGRNWTFPQRPVRPATTRPSFIRKARSISPMRSQRCGPQASRSQARPEAEHFQRDEPRKCRRSGFARRTSLATSLPLECATRTGWPPLTRTLKSRVARLPAGAGQASSVAVRRPGH